MPRTYITALVSTLVCACASEPEPAPEPSAPEPAPVVEPASASAPAPASTSCERPVEPERVELPASGTTQLASGLELQFAGSSWDHYEDGSFDQLAEFHFRLGEQDTSEIVSALAPTDPPQFRPVLGLCWRLVELSETGAVVEVAKSGQASSG